MANSEPADRKPSIQEQFDWVPSQTEPSVMLPSMILESSADDGSMEPLILSWSNPEDRRKMLLYCSWGIRSGARVQLMELSPEDFSDEYAESIGVRIRSSELELDEEEPSAPRLEILS